MSLTGTNALCTLTDLKTELGISGSSEDTRLERLILAATDAINRYCGRSFHYEAARVDDLKGLGTVLMHLPKVPVLSIGSIVWDPNDAAETVDSGLYLLDNGNQGRVYREDGWDWTASMQRGLVDTPLPGTEQSLYRVTYACGYVTAQQVIDDDTLTRTLPYALEDACLQLASQRYKWAARDPSIKSEKLLSWSASYGDAGGGGGGLVPESLAGVLDTYRRIVWA